jgi:hypothetical protein
MGEGQAPRPWGATPEPHTGHLLTFGLERANGLGQACEEGCRHQCAFDGVGGGRREGPGRPPGPDHRRRSDGEVQWPRRTLQSHTWLCDDRRVLGPQRARRLKWAPGRQALRHRPHASHLRATRCRESSKWPQPPIERQRGHSGAGWRCCQNHCDHPVLFFSRHPYSTCPGALLAGGMVGVSRNAVRRLEGVVD